MFDQGYHTVVQGTFCVVSCRTGDAPNLPQHLLQGLEKPARPPALAAAIGGCC